MAGEDSPGAETRGRRHHPGRRLLVKFVSADSYGLIVLLVVVTYLVSVSLSTSWAQTVVLAVQMDLEDAFLAHQVVVFEPALRAQLQDRAARIVWAELGPAAGVIGAAALNIP